MRIVLSVFLCFVFLGLQLSAQDLPSKPQAETSTTAQEDSPVLRQKYLQEKRAFLLKLNDQYEQKSQDPEETRRAFIKLHRHYIDVVCAQRDRISWAELYAEARAFLKLDPKDPLSLIQTGRIITGSGLDDQVLVTLKMVQGAEARIEGYSPYAKLLAIRARTEIDYGLVLSKKQIADVFDKHLVLLFEWMNQKGQSDSLQRLMFEEAAWLLDDVDGLWDQIDVKFRSKFLKAINNSKNLSPWLKNMLLADCNFEIAWEHRGNGFAGSVTEAGWEGLHKHLAIAEKHFNKAYALKPNRPEAAASMIAVAMAGDTELDEQVWFDRATAAELDNVIAYNRMITSLRPRWGGSHQKMIDFGRQCQQTGRYDTFIPFVFCDGLRLIKSDLDLEPDELKKIYRDVHQVCNNYEKFLNEKGFSPLADKHYHRGVDFGFAIQWELWLEAQKVYQQHNGEIFSKIAENKFGINFKEMAGFAFAVNGDASELVKSIHQRMESGLKGHQRTAEQSAQLLSDIEEARMVDGIPEAEPYLRLKQELVEKQLDFHEGDWVELTFTKDLRHWQIIGGKFTVEAPNSLLSYSEGEGVQYISYLTSFPPPYELELTVESIEANSNLSKHLQAGFTCGRQYGPQSGRFFWVDGIRGRTGVGVPGEPPAGIGIPREAKINDLKVNVFNGYYEHFVTNGQDRHLIALDKEFEPGRVGLALLPWYKISGRVRFKNLRVRKLNIKPPPLAEDNLAIIDYYRERLKTNQNSSFHIRVGLALGELEKSDEAIKSFKEAAKLNPKDYFPLTMQGYELFKQKKYSAALKAHLASLKKCTGPYRPRRSSVLTNLILVYGACPDESVRDGKQAVKYAKQLQKLNQKKKLTWKVLSTMSIAFAEDQQFEKAIGFCKQGLGKAKTDEEREFLNKKIKLYQQKKAFRLD